MTIADRAEPYTRTELAAAERAATRRRPAGDPTPPDPVDHQVAAPSKVSPDRVVDQLGLPHHPDPPDLAGTLRDLAKLLDGDAPRAIRYAALYAARGWPGQTMGDGTGARSSSGLTSTESAVIGQVNEATAIGLAIRSGHFDGVDRRLARLLRFADQLANEITTVVTDLVAHAEDLDPIPAGTGECLCCAHFCRPARNPNDRLRAGLCDACRKAFARASAAAGEGGLERSTWMHQRRHQLRDGQVGACDLCKRPWTAPAEGAA